MADPIVDPSDLGTYLNVPNIEQERAMALIVDAQTLCETVVSPLPAVATIVVKRVAGRAYVATAPRLLADNSPFQEASTGNMAGVYLTRYDEQDLRRMEGGGGAFAIDLLGADYTAPVSWGYYPTWDEPL